MTQKEYMIVDAHVHVGLMGDRWPEFGQMSQPYQESVSYKIFLKFLGLEEDTVCDTVMREETVKRIAASGIDRAVLLALDPVYSVDGKRQRERSHMWVSNEYVDELCREPRLRGRALFGCSVHPYDPDFENRVKEWVDKEAVLIKWLPSAQQIDLSRDQVGKALKFLARAGGGGKPLPLLLHTGPEYAIPSTDERTRPYDFLSWSLKDRLINWFRLKNRWTAPDMNRVHRNLRAALDEGAIIIFAHCGLPYFFSGILGRLFEHDEFTAVRRYLLDTEAKRFPGRCYADVSALATPFRRKYFRKVAALPPELLLYGSDFPTPAFELSADLKEILADLRAMLKGDLGRIVIPQDNLMDVNLRELRNAFPGHPLFYNWARQLL